MRSATGSAVAIVAALWIGWHGVPVVFLAGVIAALAWWAIVIGRPSSSAATRTTVHGDTTSWKAAAAHEAAHAAVAYDVGSSDIAARIERSGAGWTSYRPPQWMTPTEQIAVALAGSIGEGVPITSRQCRGDARSIERSLRHVGWWAKASTMRNAERLAAKGLRRRSRYARRTEQRLLRSGRCRGR